MATGDGPYCFEHGFARCGCVNSYDSAELGKERYPAWIGIRDAKIMVYLLHIIENSYEPDTVRVAKLAMKEFEK